MRGLSAVGMVLVLLLSGCASKAPDGTGTASSTSTAPGTATKTATAGTTTATGTATSTGTTTTTSPPAGANRAPTASLSGEAGNGTAALNVTFFVGGSDPDGDALNWTLSFGDGNRTVGATLPANATHAYATGGTHHVVLTVSDGKATATARLVLNLTAGSATAAKVPIVLAGHVMAPSVAYNTEGECLEVIIVDLVLGQDSVGTIHDVPPEALGGAYSFDVNGMVAIWYDSGFSPSGPEGSSGTVPEGTAQVIACSESAIDTDYALTIVPA